MGSLRYSFGGDHPSQTTRQAVSPSGLGPRRQKGGISTPAPRRLAPAARSLPPILHIRSPGPALSCSKGSRGLSVPLRVSGIFTATTISPSSWPRQRPDRYTIRAGRNLPDKEFRYLRTVIVTAAAQSLVFLVNSRLDLFSAPCSRRVPFSRSYGVILPNSLAMIHSSTLGFSPHPPVSVYGTGSARMFLGAFLGSLLPAAIGSAVASPYFRPSEPPGLLIRAVLMPSTRYSVSGRAFRSCVPPSIRAEVKEC